MIITTEHCVNSGQGVPVFSNYGARTVQEHRCYKNCDKNERPPWLKPKRSTEVNADRMCKGISREGWKNQEVANATAGLTDSDSEVEEVAVAAHNITSA